MIPREKTGQGEADHYACQEAIGYLFRREGLLRKALTHSSVKDDRNPSNERLEFLGDAILGMVVSEYLFSMLPENDEGDLTRVKSIVVSGESLARLGAELGLDRFLKLNKGLRNKDEIPRSLLANAVEALIAAVYLDRGMEAARHWVLDHLHHYIDAVLRDGHDDKNYKSLLQQVAQKELGATPAYKVLGERGPEHAKVFRVSAVIGGREYPPGRGACKRDAEQEAAQIALEAVMNRRGGRDRGRRVPAAAPAAPAAPERPAAAARPAAARPAAARPAATRPGPAPAAAPARGEERPRRRRRRQRSSAEVGNGI